ncbi:HAD-like domain-containing protein [Geopyxis carbonaria]|nr:HAD-like domain-containing protein [Geopyxis carbonaria]
MSLFLLPRRLPRLLPRTSFARYVHTPPPTPPATPRATTPSNACTPSTPFTSPNSSPAPNPRFAFAFDIDGVLLHGARPLPSAPSTLSLLRKHRIPFLLLTNGGGRSESARVAELSELLDAPLSTSQFVQSHTPFARHASTYGTGSVLVVGGTSDHCRRVAEGYGFSHVLMPGDILSSPGAAGVSPFSNPAHYTDTAREVAAGTKIDAVFVFNDPRDWALDIQIIVDVLLAAGGVVGTRRAVDEVLRDGHVPLFFSNPDLWWANEYPHPRLGQGGFRAALEGVWRAVTGRGLVASTIGKPHRETYEYAEDVLVKWIQAQAADGKDGEEVKLDTVYMVGDNPASDIAGANGHVSARGTEWVSCLVRTGVFQARDDDGGAKVVVDDVGAAVRWAMERQGMKP